MSKFVGFVGGATQEHRVVIEGDTLKEAMDLAEFIPQMKTYTGGRYVGQLTDGRRFSFRVQSAEVAGGLHKRL